MAPPDRRRLISTTRSCPPRSRWTVAASRISPVACGLSLVEADLEERRPIGRTRHRAPARWTGRRSRPSARRRGRGGGSKSAPRPAARQSLSPYIGRLLTMASAERGTCGIIACDEARAPGEARRAWRCRARSRAAFRKVDAEAGGVRAIRAAAPKAARRCRCRYRRWRAAGRGRRCAADMAERRLDHGFQIGRRHQSPVSAGAQAQNSRLPRMRATGSPAIRAARSAPRCRRSPRHPRRPQSASTRSFGAMPKAAATSRRASSAAYRCRARRRGASPARRRTAPSVTASPLTGRAPPAGSPDAR